MNNKKILVYGDSNTWGYIPTLHPYNGDDSTVDRYDSKDMWWYPLKENNEVYVNGNNGRLANFDHVVYAGKNACKTFNDDTKNIKNIDLFVVMIGTNDFKAFYHPTVEMIVNNLAKLIEMAVSKYNCKVLVLCPPQINYNTPITIPKYTSEIDWIKEYNDALSKYAKEKGYYFASAIDCEIGIDGEHLTNKGHQLLGRIVSNEVNNI